MVMEQNIFSDHILFITNQECHQDAWPGLISHIERPSRRIVLEFCSPPQLQAFDSELMSAFLSKHNLAYISAPKCACTSIKETLFRIENGVDCVFPRNKDGHLYIAHNGKKHFIHSFYPTVPFNMQVLSVHETMRFFCVVRDPISRVRSCHRNRVIKHRELSTKALAAQTLALPANPDLNTFVDALESYRKVFSIQHHTRPLVDFLGDDTAFYDRIFAMGNLDQLSAYLEHHTGVCVPLPHRQSTDRTRSPACDDLSPDNVRKIEELFEKDYAVFGDWFQGAATA